MKYYAHSLEDRPQEEWQPLEEHLRNVAKMAGEFAGGFGSADWAIAAGQIHDLGKADGGFQGYLIHQNGLDDAEYDSTGRINHSSAGAAYAEDVVKGVPGRTLAYLAAGHHAGLPDWHSDRTGNAALSIRLLEGRENLKRIKPTANKVAKALRAPQRPPPFVKSGNYHLWVRMLYSSLVDADFLDTEAFMQSETADARSGLASLADLKVLFDRHMEEKTRNCARTPVNAVRSEILSECRSAALRAPGLFSLMVPTGGGKTLSSMAFALDHAVKYGKKRVIYVIPYTTIIEQTAAILRAIFGEMNVVEHHSNLDPEKESQRSRLASENWDAPIVVTTNVQFFESLYAAKSSRCRKLHNIVNSVVVMDEAQLIPVQWLIPCVHVIRELADNYGVSMVLSTATQPALPGLAPTEIVENPGRLYEKLKRTKICLPTDMQKSSEWIEVATQLQKHAQVLCVVNTRRDCHDLFKLMPEGTIHLSALMCGQHRSEKIAEIKRLLQESKPVRVVSTQLVEAGVDIDFSVVYRALAGLDSIAQAAGRCNREGNLLEQGQVHVFIPPKDPPRGLLAKAASTTREMGAFTNHDPQTPETFRRYFQLFYSCANDTGAEFLNSLSRDVDGRQANVPFRSAAQDFRFIDDSMQRPVVVRYGDSGKWLDRLRFAGPTREIVRRLQRYTVNLPTRMVNAMLEDGRLQVVDKDKASDIIVQSCIRYDDTGLDVYSGQVLVEDLIV